MRGRTLVSLTALAGALAVLAAAGAAHATNEVALGPLPAFALAGTNLTLSWQVLLDNATSPGDITDTAAYFDSAAHGGTDYALYAGRADGVPAGGLRYTANVSVPLTVPSTLYLVVMANISGGTTYNSTERALEIRSPPSVTLNASLDRAYVFVQRNWTVRASVAWGYGANVEVLMRADGARHSSEPFDPALYPNASVPQVGPAGEFDFVGPAGPDPYSMFFILGVTVENVTLWQAEEHSVAIMAEPIVTRDSSPPWVFGGRVATVAWSAVFNYPPRPQGTLFWDTASHAPGAPADYAFTALGAAIPATLYSFNTTLVAPAAPGRVYFILWVTILGEPFFVADSNGDPAEFSIDVRTEPMPEVVSSPAAAFVGRELPVAARAAWPYPESVQVSVLSDAAAHGTPPGGWGSVLTGAPAQGLTAGDPGNFSLPAPTAEGTVYFVVRAVVAGSTFYSAAEYALPVSPAPVVAVSAPPWALPGSIALIRVNITWAGTVPIEAVDVLYDRTSHAPGFALADYANVTPLQSGLARTYSFPLTTPPAAGVLFLLGHARIEGYDFAASGETSMALPPPPVVATPVQLTPGSGVALYGQPVNVTWSIQFSELADVASDFRWDSNSHAGPAFNFADYPNASALATKNTSASFGASLVAPNETTTLYGIVRIVLQGRNFYIDHEVAIVVLPVPTLELVSYPRTAPTNTAMLVAWKVHFAGNHTLVSHTGLHWGLISKAGLPPSLTNYPGVGGPFRGNETNFFNATIPAQASDGRVYFIVHAVVNGYHVYLPDEYTITVERAAAPGPGGFLPGLEAPASLAALAAAAYLAVGRLRVQERGTRRP